MASNTNKPTETDESYDRLYQSIVEGKLRPNEWLVELDLAQRFNDGRSAFRTALFQLEQEGLVEREPNRGARVRLVTEEEAVEMYEVQAVLEGLAARYAAGRSAKSRLSRCERFTRTCRPVLVAAIC